MRFRLRAGAYRYRPLRERHTGWDVWALQTALHACGFPLVVDGLFGPRTDEAVRHYQAGESLVVDGIAGIATQRALGLELGGVAELRHGLPVGHMKGHLESECAWQLGNYTAPYANGTRDMGPVQDNLPKAPGAAISEADCHRAFDVPAQVTRLATFIRTRYDGYWRGGSNPHVPTRRRAWELGAGAWNRPAHADLLAAGRGGALTPQQRAWLASYIERVTSYVRWPD
jgi:hypothetical protein